MQNRLAVIAASLAAIGALVAIFTGMAFSITIVFFIPWVGPFIAAAKASVLSGISFSAAGLVFGLVLWIDLGGLSNLAYRYCICSVNQKKWDLKSEYIECSNTCTDRKWEPIMLKLKQALWALFAACILLGLFAGVPGVNLVLAAAAVAAYYVAVARFNELNAYLTGNINDSDFVRCTSPLEK